VGIRTERAEASGGVTLNVALAGDPGAPMILFLHGFPEFWYAWRRQLADLSDEFLCVAPDTRGYNESDKPAHVAAYHIEHLTADAATLIDHYGGGRAIVVGHDWGGFTAWELALRQPDKVRRLVVVNAGHTHVLRRLWADPESVQSQRSRYMLAFRSPRGEELVSRDDFAGFRANILEPGVAAGFLGEADVAAYLEAWRRPGAIKAGLDYYRANRTGPNQDRGPVPPPEKEGRVAVPTLVIWGGRDEYFDTEANLGALPALVPDLRVEPFPDNDHWIVHQRSDDVSALIRAFASAG